MTINYLKEIKKKLAEMPPKSQKVIACHFVRNIFRFLDQETRIRYSDYIELLERYLNERSTIEEVHQKYESLLEGEWSTIIHDESRSSSALSKIGGLIRLLTLTCCKTDFEKAGLKPRTTKFQPTAFDIALETTKRFISYKSEQREEQRWQLKETEEWNSRTKIDGIPPQEKP